MIFITIAVLVLAFVGILLENKTAVAYERPEVWELQIEESGRRSGCSVSGTCSESLTRLYLKDRPKYYSKYEQDSEEYWWAYCTLTDKCK